MASCLRLGDVILRGLDAEGAPGAKRAADGFASKLASERIALRDALTKKLPREGAVLTVSASGTVLDALCAGPPLRVVCAISEPGGEGETAAEILRAHGRETLMIPDGAVAQQSTRVDAIVVGSDVLGPNALLNKTGTLGAALGARSASRPCICAAGTSKLVDEQTWNRVAAMSERLAVEGVRAFEEVPTELVTTFITEDGPTTPRQLRRAARNVKILPQIREWIQAPGV